MSPDMATSPWQEVPQNWMSTSADFGDIDVSELHAPQAAAVLSGFGDCEIHSSGSVDVNLSGFGDLVVHGKPSTKNIVKSGFGSVRIAD